MIERAQKRGMSACMLVLGILLAFMAPGRVGHVGCRDGPLHHAHSA